MGSALPRPPGPIGNPLLGPLSEFLRQPADFLLKTAKEYGDLTYFRLGLQRMYLLNRPDFIQEVLVTQAASFKKSRIMERARLLLGDGLLTSEGDFHLRQRRLAQPAFYRDRLIGYSRTMGECAEQAQARWQHGATLDMSEEMMRLTLRIVGLTLFSRDVESEASVVGEALTEILSTFELMILPFANILQRLPLPAVRRANRALARLDTIIYGIISERRDDTADRGDLLSMLMMAQDSEGGTGSMTDKQLRDEALTLFLAGHETTSNALTWTWYLLSQNAEAEVRFHAEIDRVLGQRAPVYEDLPNLEYTERVFLESMRLYPPAWALGRMALQQVRIYNYEVPRGSICIASSYVMHRHPRFWPEPEHFDPDRFTPEAKQSRPRFAYMPFGGGPRVCIGERFASIEGVLLLAAIGRHWRFRLARDHKVEVHPQITLRPRHGMRMIAERRL